GGDGAVRVERGVPAAVVEVQVRVDDDVYFLGTNASSGERGRQQLLVGVDLAHLGGLLVADAGLDDHGVFAGADDDGVEAEQDAVLVVGRDALLPQGLGHDAEHGSAVEQVGAVGADGQLEV